ncbi:MAG TPA: TetR/AcrR family transcriptional regulator [Acidimicrobiia bacterium]|nr:TetR/AcrR family transcriptional regulator [Acidimicrobiia bacterium]
MTQTRAPRQTEDRRAEAIRAAYRLMARDGVHRVPLQQIASEAGVSKGLLIYHFQTKDGLVLAALEWVLETTEARIRELLADSSDPAEAISTVVDAVWVGPEANHDFFRFYMDGVEHEARSPEFDEFAGKAASIMNSFYREVIVAGVEAGMLSVDDPTAGAIQMRAVIEGMFLQWVQTADWRTNHALYREWCREILLKTFGWRELGN